MDFGKTIKNKTMKKIYLTLMLLISVASLFGQRFSNNNATTINLTTLAASSFPVGTLVTVQNTSGIYKIEASAPVDYNSGNADGLIVVEDANSNFAVAQIKEVLQPEFFGAKADFERHQTASYTNGSNVITCSSCSFSSNDIGKVIVVKEARVDAAYSARRVSLNSTITAVTNSTTVEIADNVDADGVDKEMFFASNNFDAFAKMFNYSKISNHQVYSLKQDATYYIVPWSSSNTSDYYITDQGYINNVPALSIEGSFVIEGNGSTLKFGEEDVQTINSNDEIYTGLYLKQDGFKSIRNLTVEAPDRMTTKTIDPNNWFAILLQTQTGDVGKLKLENVNTPGWGVNLGNRGGLYDSDNDIILDYQDVELINCKIGNKTGSNSGSAISFFSNDNPARRLTAINLHIDSSTVKQDSLYLASASMSSGSSTITITNPNFSIYDFSNTGETFNIEINGDDVGDLLSITNSNEFTVTGTASQDYTNVDIRIFASDIVSGHGIYAHPNISVDIINPIINVENGGQNATCLRFNSSGGKDISSQNYINIVNPILKEGSDAGYILLQKGDNDILQKVSISSYDTKNKAKVRFLNAKGIFDLQNINVDQTTVGLEGHLIAKNSIINPTLLESNSYIFLDNCEVTSITLEGQDTELESINSNIRTLTLSNENTVNISGGKFRDLRVRNTPAQMSNSKVIIKDVEKFGQVNFSINFANAFYSLTESELTNLRDNLILERESDGNNVDNDNINYPSGFEIYRNVTNENVLGSRNNYNESNVTNKINEYQEGNIIYSDANFDNQYVNFTNSTISYLITLPAINQIVSNSATYVFSDFKRCFLKSRTYKGDYSITPVTNQFRFKTGGNIRVKSTQNRILNEPIRFENISKGVFVERTDYKYFSNTTPLNSGVINEIVYNNSNSPVDFWRYEVTISDVTAETHDLSSATLPFEFDLTNGAPYLAFEESYFVDPSTLLTITIPLSGGGSEVFTSDVFGHLTGSNGGEGDIRLSDGHIKINSLGSGILDTSSDLSIDYKYISSSNWTPYYKANDYQEGSGNPFGTVNPDYVGQMYLDNAALPKVWYKATGLTNTDWQAL